MNDPRQRVGPGRKRVVLALDCEEHARSFDACAALPVEIRYARFAPAGQGSSALGTTTAGAVAPELRAALQQTEILFAPAPPHDVIRLAPFLRWVATPVTGTDHLGATGIFGASITVTTIGSLVAGMVAEHAFALLFALTRRLAEFGDAQRSRQWRTLPVRELQGATMAVVGLGNVGRAVARAAKAFGMRVLALRRNPGGTVDGVDRVYPASKLVETLAQADVVVVSVPGSMETAGLIGAAEIAAMKPGALLVNVARGSVFDEPALCEALRSGRLGGAGLDVFAAEPLPKSSPLWTLPNVVLTPHVAVAIPSLMPRAIAHFAANLERYCKGEPLKDVVRPAR